MLETMNIMQEEHRFVALWELLERSLQIHPIEQAHKIQIRRSEFNSGPLAFLVSPGQIIQRDRDNSLFTKAHKHNIRCQSMQPGSESGFAAKSVNFAE